MSALRSPIRQILYLLDNRVLIDRTVAADGFDVASLESAQAIVGTGDGSFKTVLDLGDDIGEVQLSWTGADGCALSSVSSRGRPILSTFLSDGSNPDGDAELLGMFLSSLRRSRPVLDHNPGNAAPFPQLLAERHRPFYGAVLIPVLERSACNVVVDFHACCAAAFLWRPTAGAEAS